MTRGPGTTARLLAPALLLAAAATCTPAWAADPPDPEVAVPASTEGAGVAGRSGAAEGPAHAEAAATDMARAEVLLQEADAQRSGAATPSTAKPAAVPDSTTSGTAIYRRFVEGLSQPACEDPSPRWRAHYAHVPAQLASGEGELLALFGYVVESLRSAHLPTEYALIPFVESGYRPGARSPSGPAGLWQFMAATARNHDIAVRRGHDGRLSPVEATRAAVRYLRTLHGMFAGDWRLAVMAFNAGEYRVLSALRRHGQKPASARPDQLESLSGITRAYVRKVHALSCLMVEAGTDEAWTRALDRPVARLVAVDLAGEPAGLEGYARRNGLDPARLLRLNPSHARGAGGTRILAPVAAAAGGPAVPPVAN